MSGPTLLLVDALAVLYRSFYAIRGLSTEDGRPTNALFGFVRKVRQLSGALDPTHLAVVFDGGLPEDRLQLLETYKAQRPPMPDALRSQVALAKEYLASADIAWELVERQEADDVIASFATRASNEGASVRIATSDKDLYQLVDERVRVVPLGGRDILEIGTEEVRKKTGVPPEHIVEWLALVGDTADNVPGVPGVGPKTAARLLNEFGSLLALWDGLGSVASPKLKEALQANRDVVERNVRMVKLNSDLAVDRPWEEAFRVRAPDAAKLRSFFQRVEFHKMADEFREPSQLDLF